eukprot:430093-Hanusia_phi.AAC.1
MDLRRLPSKMRNKPSFEMEQTTCKPTTLLLSWTSCRFPEITSPASTTSFFGFSSAGLRGEVLGEL